MQNRLNNWLLATPWCIFLLGFCIQTTAANGVPSRQGLKATDDAEIQYSLEFDQASAHYLQVSMTCQVQADQTEIMMPSWTPGSYLMREYARFVDHESAMGDDKKSRKVTKSRKNRWTVNSQDTKTITFSYRLYCHELSVRTNWVDADLAVLNGAATFVVPVDRLTQSISVKVNLPRSWPRSVCALPESETTPHTYLAANYDQLVDSPIFCGDCHIFPFKVGGVNHYLVNLGDDESWDGQKAVGDLKKMVAQHHKFWGVIPYQEYYFMNVVLGGGGGLEHDNCTMIMSSRWTCSSPKSYTSWLTLCSHEFFHAWNVRRLRPEALNQYDYENEVYLRQLWIAEGITSYYEKIAVVRAGLISESDLLQNLSSDIRSTQSTPGNTVQSLSDSSFDTWIKFYRPHENSRNTSVSYYSRGAVAAFVLDAEIRSLTKNEKSLDDVMVAMYQNHLEAGYSSQQFRDQCTAVAGTDMNPWFEKYVDLPNEFDYESALNHFGLQFDHTKKPDAETNITLGARVGDTDGRATVASITPGSPAFLAGLNLNDEIIAVESRRISSNSLTKELEQFKAGDIVELLTARRGKLRVAKIQLASQKSETWNLNKRKQSTDLQKQNLKLWLNTEGPKGDEAASETENETQTVEESEKSTEKSSDDDDGSNS